MRISMCHCFACQRQTGSAFSMQARYPKEQVQVEGRYSDYVRENDEGEERTFHFCPDCGSTVWYQTDPELIAVRIGNFADPSFPPPRSRCGNQATGIPGSPARRRGARLAAELPRATIRANFESARAARPSPGGRRASPASFSGVPVPAQPGASTVPVRRSPLGSGRRPSARSRVRLIVFRIRRSSSCVGTPKSRIGSRCRSHRHGYGRSFDRRDPRGRAVSHRHGHHPRTRRRLSRCADARRACVPARLHTHPHDWFSRSVAGADISGSCFCIVTPDTPRSTRRPSCPARHGSRRLWRRGPPRQP